MPRQTLRLLLAALATASLLSACTSPTAPDAAANDDAPAPRSGVVAGSGT